MTLVDFLYSHPTWEIGLLLIVIWTGLSLLGLYIFHRMVDVHMRREDTETVGLTYAIVAVVYAVLLAFIVVDVFDAFSKGEEVVTAEANKVSTLLLDASGLPPQMGSVVHADLEKYLDIVTKSEWPSQRTGKLDTAVFEPGWTVVAHLDALLASFEPATLGQNVNKGEMLHGMNDLIKARRTRILAAKAHLPVVVWEILLLGGAVSVAYTYLFGAHSFGIHLGVTGLIAATIALVFVLIIALDYPFRGEVSVSDAPFVGVRSTATASLQSGSQP